MIKEAIVIAGGKGTRLKEVVNDLPKPMAPVNGRPFLEHQMDYFIKWGLEKIVLAVGYRHEAIMAHFGQQYKSLQISYAIEKEPLGTGGAVRNAFRLIEGHAAFVFNGDTYYDVNLQRLHDFRWAKQTGFCLAMRKEEDTSRYGTLQIDRDNRITGFDEKGKNTGEGFINGGVYVIAKKYFCSLKLPEKFSLEKDFLEACYKTEKMYAMRCQSYFIDIGIPEDYEKAQHEL